MYLPGYTEWMGSKGVSKIKSPINVVHPTFGAMNLISFC